MCHDILNKKLSAYCNMATETKTSSATSDLRLRGKTTDLTINVNLEKFSKPVSEDEYTQALHLISKKLEKLSVVDATFCLNLGPNFPDLVIDARKGKEVKMIEAKDELVDLNTLDAKVYIRPILIKRFVDGLMEARYALNWGHIHVVGPTRIGVKFVDALGPFGAVHPRLDPSKAASLPRPTEDVTKSDKI